MITLERNHLNLCEKSEVGFLGEATSDCLFFSYMPLNVCWFSEVSFQLAMSVTYINLQVKLVWKLKKIYIECYREFLSGITPKDFKQEVESLQVT